VVADWSPEQYRRFAVERAEPFHDLIGLIEAGGIHRAVDLGCGPGELTALAKERLGIGEMTGIDNSSAMLAAAEEHTAAGLCFERGDIASWTSAGDLDLVLAAASLQWVPDHAAVLARWTSALRPGGQLAVQVPANACMPSHTVAQTVAGTEPYLSAFGADGPPADPVAVNVLQPEDYATLLYDLGFQRQHVHLRVYGHVLASSADVVEWLKGTSLTRFEKRLTPELYQRFLDDYRAALLDVIGTHAPYFFPFRRILFWGRLAS
jgi:trans-aconitate 2-methyltransferase